MDVYLSIVIANYNYGRFLEAAIKSVLQQMTPEMELIIVDGRSTDNSVEIIRKNQDRIAWWVSERDQGQSDAFNKGFAHAKGKFLTWLNADDVFMPGALSKVIREIKRHPSCQWFTGNFFRFNEEGRVVQVGWGPHIYPRFLQRANSPIVTFGPSTFFSKAIFEAVGGIDVNLNYVMDIDLWLKFMRQGITMRRINALCWGFRMHQESKTAQYDGHRMVEAQYKRLCQEADLVKDRLCYRMSRFLYVLVMIVRLLDGSMVHRFWLALTFRRFNVKELLDR